MSSDQKTSAVVLTVAASIVIVPVVFIFSAIAWWNLLVPLLNGFVKSSSAQQVATIFVYRLTMPFVNSVTSVYEVYGYMQKVIEKKRMVDPPS